MSSLTFVVLLLQSLIVNDFPLSHKHRQVLKPHEPVYQAIWVDNMDFDEVLISPAMIQDHMPDTVLAALNKVSMTTGCSFFDGKVSITNVFFFKFK